MLGARYTGEIYADGKRLTDPDGWLTGVADGSKAAVMRHLHHYVDMKLVPRWIAEHHVEFHILDRKTNKKIVI